MWYHKIVGEERCAIVDTWFQTETGGILITPLPWRHPNLNRGQPQDHFLALNRF
jgi:acyl-coenzyme A synthetase/AMP-(fatty) acid ligase